MKKILFLSLFLFSALTIQAQRVPEIVKSNFKNQYPSAQKIKYSKEADGSWEVDFIINKTISSAKFSSEGLWLETEQHIKFADVPAAVQNFVNSSYKGFEVEVCEVVNRPQAKFYEIFVEKGRTVLELLVSPEGQLIEEKKAKKKESKKE